MEVVEENIDRLPFGLDRSEVKREILCGDDGDWPNDADGERGKNEL